MAGLEDARGLGGYKRTKLQAVPMPLAISHDRLHDLGAILVGKDEFHLQLFTQQQLYRRIARHTANRHFDAAAIHAGLLPIAHDGDADTKVQRVARPAALPRPVLLGLCRRSCTHASCSVVSLDRNSNERWCCLAVTRAFLYISRSNQSIWR